MPVPGLTSLAVVFSRLTWRLAEKRRWLPGIAEGDTRAFLARPDDMGEFIAEVVATCDYAAARRRSAGRTHG